MEHKSEYKWEESMKKTKLYGSMGTSITEQGVNWLTFKPGHFGNTHIGSLFFASLFLILHILDYTDHIVEEHKLSRFR